MTYQEALNLWGRKQALDAGRVPDETKDARLFSDEGSPAYSEVTPGEPPSIWLTVPCLDPRLDEPYPYFEKTFAPSHYIEVIRQLIEVGNTP